MAAPGDEVQLDAPHPKAMRHHFPASGLEITDRLFFTGEPSLVAGICPRGWIAVDAVRHGDKLPAHEGCR
jgi:hypothetical protein